MKQNERIGKIKEKHTGIAVYENPRDGFEEYRSGIEITNQVAMNETIPLE